MSRSGACLAAVVLLAGAAFVSGAETSGKDPGAVSVTVQKPAAGPAAPAGGGILLPMTTGFVSGADGQEKDGGAAGQASSSTAAAVIPDSGPVIPVNHCHCIVPKTPSPMDPMPYYIGVLTTVSPLCEKIKLKFDGRPVLEQLVFCKELGDCWRSTAQYAEKKRRLEREISDARDIAVGCCPGDGPGQSGQESPGCDMRCRKTWEKKAAEFAREKGKIEQGGRASMEKCVSDAIEKRKKNAAGKK